MTNEEKYARRQLRSLGFHTFCFVGAVAAAVWGEFYWDKVFGASICACFFSLQLFETVKLAQKR